MHGATTAFPTPHEVQYIFNIQYNEVNPSALLCLNNSCHNFNVCVCLSSETVINVRQIEVQQHAYYNNYTAISADTYYQEPCEFMLGRVGW